MINKTCFVFLLAVLPTLAQAGKVEILVEGARERARAKNFIPDPRTKEGVFQQKIDHLNSKDIRTFGQHFWHATGYGNAPNAPVILYLCGEGKCGGGAFMGPLSVPARQLKARMFALEHRYYGQSQPFADLSTANLAYLSTEQALQDILNFKNAMTRQFGLTGSWIIVGGSYAGNLAAYFRSRYPEQVRGAIASSAPIWASADFKEYDHMVAKWAGAECVKAIDKSLQQIEAALVSDEGFAKIKEQFNAQSVSRRDDFLYLLSDITSASIQYDLKTEFCETVEKMGADGYAIMKKKVDQKYGLFSDYTAEEAENTSVAKHAGPLGMRQWFYQSCTEYGYWQNAWPDRNESARSQQINSEYHNNLCRRLFGLSGAMSTAPLVKTYSEPLLSATTSKIFFTSGSEDPWGVLTIGERAIENPAVESRLLIGARHCDDLGPGGVPAVMAAKTRVQALMAEWLR